MNAEQLQEFLDLYAKYGDDFPKLLELFHAIKQKDPNTAIADITYVASDVLESLGYTTVVPLIGIGIQGITKLIAIIKSSGEKDWTPEKIHAEVLRLKAEDDALDVEFPTP